MTLNKAISQINNTLIQKEMKILDVSQLLADLFQKEAGYDVQMSRGVFSLRKQTFDIVFSDKNKSIASTFKIRYERGQGEVLKMLVKSISLPKEFRFDLDSPTPEYAKWVKEDKPSDFNVFFNDVEPIGKNPN